MLKAVFTSFDKNNNMLCFNAQKYSQQYAEQYAQQKRQNWVACKC